MIKKNTSIECETFGSYFLCHGEHLYKIFYFAWLSSKVIKLFNWNKCIKWSKSEIKVINKYVK